MNCTKRDKYRAEGKRGAGRVSVMAFLLFLSFHVAVSVRSIHAETDRIVMECSAPLHGTFVTVYSRGMALVKEKRTVSLPMGDSEIRCMDIPETIEPQSVSVRFLSSPEKITMQEQTYEPGVVDPQALLDSYVGKKVILVERSSTTLEEKRTEAQLISTRSGNVYRIGKDLLIGHPGQVILPDYQKEINDKPYVAWRVNATQACDQELEVSYLADGLSWSADYVLLLNDNDAVSRFSAWVTLVNNAKRSFNNSTVSLVAGDVQRRKMAEPAYAAAKTERAMALAAPAPQVEESPFFEYHLYRLPQKISLGANRMHQVAFFSLSDVPARKEYVFRSSPSWGRGVPGEPQKSKADVYIVLPNKADNKTGRALPAGTVRVYKAAGEGENLLVGEDAIPATPLDSEVKITAGKSFDVEMERKQVSFQKLGPTLFQEGYEMNLKNAKSEDVSVRVIESLYGDWEITKSDRQWKRLDAQTIEFTVPVPARGRASVSYTASMQR